jgi:hypothetical protein
LIEAEIEQIYDNELQAIQQNSIKFSKSFNSEKEIAENLIDEAKLNPNLKQFIRFIFAVEVDWDALKHLKHAFDDWSSDSEDFLDHEEMREQLCNNNLINNEALVHSMNKKSEIMVRYVLKRWNSLYLNTSVSERFLTEFVKQINEPEVLEILQVLWSSSIYLAMGYRDIEKQHQ